MSDPIVRGVRTFLWSFLGSLMTSGILSTMTVDGVVDWAVVQKGAISALAAGIAGFISWAYNALEDKDVAPKLLGK